MFIRLGDELKNIKNVDSIYTVNGLDKGKEKFFIQFGCNGKEDNFVQEYKSRVERDKAFIKIEQQLTT